MTKERTHDIPEYKKQTVAKLVKHMQTSKTILLASTKGLPGSQFHEIKKKMRGTAEIYVAKKSLVLRALKESKASGIEELESQIGADVAVFFSDMDAFELSGLLTDSQSPTKAKAGDIAPEDIVIEAGGTDLIPGPAISELSSVGLKVAVEGGKLAIKAAVTVAKKGDPIKDNVAGVLAKLNILPMKVGFIPIAAYDKNANKVYVGIRIDKKTAYEEMKDAIAKALGFALNIKYTSKETVGFFLGQAAAEAEALSAKTSSTTTKEGM